jgi:hypothetical protein
MDIESKMNWSEIEQTITYCYTRIVYSDEEDFDSEPWPEKIIFIKKVGMDSYVSKYNALMHTFVHYKVPNYNRTCATMRLAGNHGDKATPTDVNGNELLVEKYKV